MNQKTITPLIAENLPGWFSRAECNKLYSITVNSEGDILEIGHFLGRSTACICQGLRESGKVRVFNSYDLAFESDESFKSFYEQVHETDIDSCELLTKYVFPHNTNATAVAKSNLGQYDLDQYVNLIAGDFSILDSSMYSLIFSDAMHDPNEIRINLPHIKERSKKGCIWAFHDMNQENIEVVLSMSESKLIDTADSLGVFSYQ